MPRIVALPHAQRAAITRENARKAEALREDIEALKERWKGDIEQLAKTHGQKVSVISQTMYEGAMLKKERAPSLYLAASHAVCERERQAGRPVDIRNEAIKQLIQKECKEYEDDDAKGLEALGNLTAHREASKTLKRGTSQAVLKDTQGLVTRLKTETSAYAERTGAKYLVVILRGNAHDLAEPNVFGSPEIEEFFEVVVKKPLPHLVLLMESFVVAGAEGAKDTCRARVNDLKHKISELLTQKLQSITENEKVAMVYENFKERVADRFWIELVGWPLLKVVSPSKIPNETDLRAVHEALVNGACHFRKMTKEQIADRQATLRSEKAERRRQARQAAEETSAPTDAQEAAQTAERSAAKAAAKELTRTKRKRVGAGAENGTSKKKKKSAASADRPQDTSLVDVTNVVSGIVPLPAHHSQRSANEEVGRASSVFPALSAINLESTALTTVNAIHTPASPAIADADNVPDGAPALKHGLIDDLYGNFSTHHFGGAPYHHRPTWPATDPVTVPTYTYETQLSDWRPPSSQVIPSGWGAHQYMQRGGDMQ